MTFGIEIRRAASDIPPRGFRGASAAGGEAQGISSLKVLIVEDESIIGWALQTLLEDLGHEVVCVASSGRAAIAAAAEHHPELVFMDINLGTGMNGIEAAERIGAWGTARIVFVTAYGDGGTRATIAERVPGALLLAKPVSAPSIQAAIARLFSRDN